MTENELSMAHLITHSSGETCPEESRKVPERFKVCCPIFDGHTRSCYYDIRYEYVFKAKFWGIVIPPEAGGGHIEISYCPHCGSRLAPLSGEK